MTVYIVVAEKYHDDHEIIAVFDDEEAAGRFALAWAASNKTRIPEIESWPVSAE